MCKMCNPDLLICFQLLDLQLSDGTFRRFVLVQFLFIFHYLEAEIKFKTYVQTVLQIARQIKV